MRLSLCMIVKNEEEYLPKCLASAKPWVDEIVIVDTGSTDRTVRIAESFGARVLHFPWTGDFSAARNCSLDAATGDWIMFLDADEEIVDEDGPKLRDLLAQPGYSGWYVNLISFVGDKPGQEAVGNVAFRLFTNHPKHRFTGRLHEQVVAAVQLNGGQIGFSNVRLNHYGYLNKPTIEKNKLSRNFEILLKEVEDRPEDPFVHFNLGVEYMRQGKSEEALHSYQQAFKRLPTLEIAYASVLVRNIVLCLNNLKRFDEALKVLKDAV
ncbi:MAG TPA: glycosyltransferase, partial [Firmicutes bacterium]|nr:glycosyltransferase [Bacillota bacterium]